MNDANQIVEALLGDEGEDPKDFLLDRNADLAFDPAFVLNGWQVRGHHEYGKMNPDNDVRWITELYEHNGTWNAVFMGQKLFEIEDRFGRTHRDWQDFEIDGEIMLKPGQSINDFILEIEDFLCDKTGPDEPFIQEPDYDDQDD